VYRNETNWPVPMNCFRLPEASPWPGVGFATLPRAILSRPMSLSSPRWRTPALTAIA
jgi:hypothetical protein